MRRPPPDTLVYGVTPAEALTGSDQVYIQGRHFDLGSIEVVLKDPSDPVAVLPPVGLVTKTPHSLRVAIPSFTTNRAKYQLVVRRDGVDATETVPGRSSYLYLRSSGAQPQASSIRVQYVNWGWVFDCGGAEWDYGTSRRRSGTDPAPCGCDTNGMSGGFPSWYPSVWPTAGSEPWSVGIWSDWQRHADQASRDWGTVCSEAWNPGGTSFVDGLVEAYPRVTLVNNQVFWLDLTPTRFQLKGLANGGWYTPIECPVGSPGCESNPAWDPSEAYYDPDPLVQRFFFSCRFVYTDDDGVLQQPACDIWTGNRPDVVVVHNVGSFWKEGEEVDPLDIVDGMRAVTNPQSIVSTNGMVLVSYNQMVGSRPNPDPATYPGGSVAWAPPGNGCLGAIALEADNPDQIGWWGPPDHERDTTPNLLAHELLHAVGGEKQQHHSLTPDSSIPDRMLVGVDIDDCGSTSDPVGCRNVASRRGYRIDLPEIPGGDPAFSTEQACAAVLASPFGE